MKQDASFFENQEPVLIYIAKKLRDALRLEGVLAACGVDYDGAAEALRIDGIRAGSGGFGRSGDGSARDD